MDSFKNVLTKRQEERHAEIVFDEIMSILLTKDISEKHKISELVKLEQCNFILKIEARLSIFFQFLHDNFNSNCTDIYKAQLILTGTTVIVFLEGTAAFPKVAFNFINFILLDLIKNTRNYQNAYLRKIACQSLEELEINVPGLLLPILGIKNDLLTAIGLVLNETEERENTTEIPHFNRKLEIKSK